VIAQRRQQIRRQGDDASAHYNLGTLLQSGGQLDAAILEYREALRLRPDLTDSTLALAGVLWDKGALDEMVAVLKQAVARAADNSALRARLAEALLLAGDREGYRRACAETLERFRHATGWHAARACLIAPDALDDFSIPLEMAEKARQQSSNVVSAYIQGLALYRAGQHAQAVQVLGSAIEAEPHWHAHALTRVVLAMAHHRLGHAEEARRWLEKAHDPYGGEAWGVKPGEAIGASAPWWDRADFQILSREADTLILGPAAATRAVVP
jgi:tetratricopeptide (TPR) repeat protein